MKCVICGKDIKDKCGYYCKNIHCQQKYERKMAMVHNTREYREYIIFYRMSEEQAYFRGDIEQY